MRSAQGRLQSMIEDQGHRTEGNCDMRQRNARITVTLRQTIAVFTTLVALILIANSAHGRAAAHRGESALAATAGLLPGGSPSPATGLNLGFAMADFTGDTHPDLATVALNRFDSASAQYVIEIRLTEGGHQFLRLTAPFGGILITPKDVTGDGNLDLVIRSARSRIPVAVFLNDGYGHFFAADPSAFTRFIREASSEHDFAPKHFYFSATLVSPKSYAINRQNAALRNSHEQSESLFPANCGTPSQLFVPFGLTRAPPTVA
jgi:hypothetical protein